MRYFLSSSLLLGLLILPGCVVPVPHQRLHEFGVRGRLLDSDSRTPIAAAKIQASEDGAKVTQSDANGLFALKPVYGWHGAYLIGPIDLSLFPGFDMPSPSRAILITARGHRTATVSFRIASTENLYIQAGDILLKPQ